MAPQPLPAPFVSSRGGSSDELPLPRGGASRALGTPTSGLETARRQFAVTAWGGSTEWDLSEFLTGATWSDSFDQPAQQLDLTLADPDGRLNTYIKAGGGVRLFGAIPQPGGGFEPLRRLAGNQGYPVVNELFRGYVFSKSTSSAVTGQELNVTAYDNMVYLAKNSWDHVFRDQTATEIILGLMDKYELRRFPTGTAAFVDTAYRIPRLVTFGLTVWDACHLALQKTHHAHPTKRYLLRSEHGIVALRARDAAPDRVWTFDLDGGDVLNSQRSVNIENLATSLQISSAGRYGRRVLGGYVSDRRLVQLFGQMSQVKEIGSTDPAEARANAAGALKTASVPEESLNVSVPLVASIRPGDVVHVQDQEAGIVGVFFVQTTSHTVSVLEAQSDLTLVRQVEQAEYGAVTEDTSDYAARERWAVVRKDRKVVSFTVSVGVYTPAGSNQIGDETLARVDKSHPLADYRRIRVFRGHTHIDVAVDAKGDYPQTVQISKSAAEQIGLGLSDTAALKVEPLTQVTTSSAAAGGGGDGDPTLVAAIVRQARAAGADPVVMVATAMVESNLNWTAEGDVAAKTGLPTSFGPFQHHQGGALGDHTQAWAESEEAVAERARAFAAAGVRDGAGAAAVQRPSDRPAYARKVDANLSDAARLVGTYG
jgi:hypothetical protein